DMTGSNDPSGQTGAGSLIINGPGIVVLDASNTFTGGISLNAGTLELTAVGAAGSGSITFASTTDPTLEFTAANTPSSNPILNFGANDAIVIDGYRVVAKSYHLGILTLDGSGGTFQLTISGPGLSDISDFDFAVDPVANTTTITSAIPCYCAGTLISTPRGDVPVEELTIGDEVLTLAGEPRPIKWIGRRSFRRPFMARNVSPIRIKTGALGENAPLRDLYVSPDHAMYVDEVLVPAEHLVNGISIVRCPDVDSVHYFHIELDR